LVGIYTNDYGNYLTGYTLKKLGYSEWDARVGAHINNAVNGVSDHGSREYSGWLDSALDQRAIANGYHHGKTSYGENPYLWLPRNMW